MIGALQAPSNFSPVRLEQDAEASAVVIAQRLRPLGFQGGLSILKEYLRSVRVSTPAKRAYVRMEPGPGERFEIDWGHFGVLSYQGYARKLYAFCLVECHSRKLYVEFTHSKSFETFVRCHIHAFHYLGGVAGELWYDNLATAVGHFLSSPLCRDWARFKTLVRNSGVSGTGTAQLEVGDKQDSIILMALLRMVLFQRSARS